LKLLSGIISFRAADETVRGSAAHEDFRQPFELMQLQAYALYADYNQPLGLK
jgi:hypothetical protein